MTPGTAKMSAKQKRPLVSSYVLDMIIHNTSCPLRRGENGYTTYYIGAT